MPIREGVHKRVERLQGLRARDEIRVDAAAKILAKRSSPST